jgi:heme-degrading monooxygenase HmoA
MIARTWHATATYEQASAYQYHFTTKVVPHLKTIPGYVGASLLRREIDDGVEFLAMTLWHSLDSIQAFTGPDPEKAVVDREAEAVLTRFDPTAANYELAYTDDPAGAGARP